MTCFTEQQTAPPVSRPPSDANGDVLATLRVVFSVSRLQQYSDGFVQDLLRAGLGAELHGKPLEVPEYGGINSIVLLGSGTSASNCCRLSEVLTPLSVCLSVLQVRVGSRSTTSATTPWVSH